MTERGCFNDALNEFDDGECKEETVQGVTGTVCVCDSNLCNGVEKMIPHLTMFVSTTLLAYYVM